ncbi:MAG: diguanylate cyclase [Acidobacteria bacterium]|nr:diguanylate cyclase [Acidobacteriota bacterium]
MEKKDTKAFGDQTIEFQMSEWTSFTGSEGFYFTVIEGADFGRVFLLEKPEMVLGRSDEADIQLDDEKVSRKHLKLYMIKNHKGEARAKVADLSSKNGIFVNGVRAYEQELRSGDKIKVGDTILKFEIKDRLDVSYHDKLYQQATRDPLTALSNRNYFRNELRKFVSLAVRYNRALSIIMLDIDFFKKINDTYGHDVGDNVLKGVSEVLMRHVRNHDVAARFGGEEFVMLLPETNLGGAVVVAERIRTAVENVNFESLGCRRQVTISIGVAEYEGDTTSDGEDILKRADEALYRAKTSGRNRVCVSN